MTAPGDRAEGGEPAVTAREGRHTTVGGLPVTRVLPTKGRRTVGPWCFVDLMGPVDAERPDPMEVGPHPHIGLHTATWLLEGEALHTDSLGSEQVIRPGQLNLMTAGRGIAHAELAARPPFRGAQMWIAQPDATRDGTPAFAHHPELPQLELAGGEALVMLGTHAGASSPGRTDSPLVGLELRARDAGPRELELERSFEYAVVPLDGRVRVGEDVVEPGWLGLVAPGGEGLRLDWDRPDGRALLLGGAPLAGEVRMWWNFVARTRDELESAWQAWRDRDDGRFGPVASSLDRIEAPTPPWIRSG